QHALTNFLNTGKRQRTARRLNITIFDDDRSVMQWSFSIEDRHQQFFRDDRTDRKTGIDKKLNVCCSNNDDERTLPALSQFFERADDEIGIFVDIKSNKELYYWIST